MFNNRLPIKTLKSPASWKIAALPLVAFLFSAILCGIILPVPDINDFGGLSQMCILMEKKGWLYCVNVNWGFAHPLLNFLITKLTKDLLISQRILSATFSFFSIVLAGRIMTRILNIKEKEVKTIFLVFMALSPWMLESLVSVHLDIAATVFILIGILMLKADRLYVHFLAGFIVSIGSWFRFHDLVFAVLYPFLVAVFHWSDQKEKRFALAMVGVLLGLSIPALLCYSAFGVFSISNQKLQFAINLPGFTWSVPYFQALESRSLIDIIRHIPWFHISARFIRICLRPEIITLLGIVALHLLDKRPSFQAFGLRPFANIAQKPSVILCLYPIIVLLPLFFIRGLSLRHEIALFIITVPILCFIYAKDTNRFQVGLLLSLLLVAISMDYSFVVEKIKRTSYLNSDAKEIMSVVPEALLEKHPERVLSTEEFYNPYNKYRRCSPVIYGGWTLLSEPMKKNLGVIDIGRMHEDVEKLQNQFDYIILRKNSRNKMSHKIYDAEILSLNAEYHFTKNFVILHFKGPAQK